METNYTETNSIQQQPYLGENNSQLPNNCNYSIAQENMAVENSMFVAKTANQWLEEAYLMPEPKQLWGEFWFEGEVSCLFADTNVGKSIYAVQIAEFVAQTRKVLYFDFEMSRKQFQMRYTDTQSGNLYTFPENFIRLEFSQDYQGTVSLYDIIRYIAAEIERTDAHVIIVDNLTWLCNRCESGDAAGELMQMLIALKRRYDLSVLVLAHTPKRNISSPLTQNSLAGSKRIANFMDSMFAIGVDATNKPQGRYVKQIKVRSADVFYGDDNVAVGEIKKEAGKLFISYDDHATEKELLADDDEPQSKQSFDTPETIEAITSDLAEGLSIRKIAEKRSIPKSSIYDIIKRHKLK